MYCLCHGCGVVYTFPGTQKSAYLVKQKPGGLVGALAVPLFLVLDGPQMRPMLTKVTGQTPPSSCPCPGSVSLPAASAARVQFYVVLMIRDRRNPELLWVSGSRVPEGPCLSGSSLAAASLGRGGYYYRGFTSPRPMGCRIFRWSRT